MTWCHGPYGLGSAQRDTAWAMSQENVEEFKRATDVLNRRDIESFLEMLDPEVEWHPALVTLLEGEATVYRGREEVGELLEAAGLPTALEADVDAVLQATARELASGVAAAGPLNSARGALEHAGFRVDYFALVDGPTLQRLAMTRRPARLIAAARLGSVRLLDNVAA